MFEKITGKSALVNYLKTIKHYRPLIDVDKSFHTTLNAIKAFNQNKRLPEEYYRVENRWYQSLLKENDPDYGVYDTDYFNTTEVWLCWTVYSRKYIKSFTSPKILLNGKTIIDDLGPIKSIGDLGCGCGYTTGYLKELFPRADVKGTNIPGTTQYLHAQELGRRYKFELTDKVERLGQRDLIFASEYFEHIIEPITHLEKVIEECRPKALIVANAFPSRAIGHFNFYFHKGEKIPNKKMSRLWNKRLRELGYESVKTKYWNNRPRYWKLAD